MTDKQIQRFLSDIDNLSYIRIHLYHGMTIYISDKPSHKDIHTYFTKEYLKKKVRTIIAEKSNYIEHINRPITVSY